MLIRHYIKVVVNNPDEFIDKQKDNRLKKIAKSNFKLFGTPICTNTKKLDLKHQDLFELINAELIKRK